MQRRTRSRVSPTASRGTDGETVNGQKVVHVEVDNAGEWEAVMSLVHQDLKIPSILSRSGLKKIHADFDAIYSKIKEKYQASIRNDRIKGAISMILIQMSMDSVLRDKLFEKGAMDLILPLLNSEHTRQLGAQGLSALSQHGSLKVRHAIAKKSNLLAKFMQDSADDYKLAFFGVTTIARCLKCVLMEGQRPGTKLEVFIHDTVDLVPILEAVLQSVKIHFSRSTTIIDDLVELFSLITIFSPGDFQECPQAIRFLVAGLRSKDWSTRGNCLGGLARLWLNKADPKAEIIDPKALFDAFKHQRHFPPHLAETLYRYGFSRCELPIAVKCGLDYSTAINDFCRDKDLCLLGMKEVEFILSSEHSILEGRNPFPESEGSRVGDPADVKTQWVYESYTKSLLLCAQALRTRNQPRDEDMADILALKSLLIFSQTQQAVKLAQNSVKRNPDQAFFYYVLSQTFNFDQALEAAKKGLKCSNVTPSLKWLLLERAVCSAVFVATTLFQRSQLVGGTEWKEAVAILTSAYEDAKMFIHTAPPDSRLMKAVGYWMVLLATTLEKNLSQDLRELDVVLKKIAVSEEFWQLIQVPPPKTSVYWAHKFVLDHFKAAQLEFSAVFEVLDKSKPMESLSPDEDELDNRLIAWLEGLNRPCLAEESHGPVVDKREYRLEAGNALNVLMYRCSWCSNPSAGLRKCNGCGNVQYCGRDCQRSHWPNHKQQCKR